MPQRDRTATRILGPASDAIRELQAFIDERWTVARPRFYPGAAERLHVAAEVSGAEAHYFLASVDPVDDEPPLLVVDDDRKQRSDRFPRLADGTERGYLFFEEPGRLRLETIVQWAAIARLYYEFGWPREHLVCESPSVVKDGRQGEVLGSGALDILLLEEPCAELAAKMPAVAVRSRVGVEAKATAKILDKLLEGMRVCHAGATPHGRSNHVKCSAIAELRPRFFLGVAAADTWRLFRVVEHDRHAVLGDELPDLGRLHFRSMSERE